MRWTILFGGVIFLGSGCQHPCKRAASRICKGLRLPGYSEPYTGEGANKMPFCKRLGDLIAAADRETLARVAAQCETVLEKGDLSHTQAITHGLLLSAALSGKHGAPGAPPSRGDGGVRSMKPR
jgi:hypothetical protein